MKYPRTRHLPYSEKPSADDKVNKSDAHYTGKEVIALIKMDGENTTVENDTSHARSLNSEPDSEDRRWIEMLRMCKVSGNIPNTYRICGENVFYRHTVPYENLPTMFMCFSIWDGGKCLSWEDTTNICDSLGLVTTPILYKGVYDKEKILNAFSEYKKNNPTEGFVIRLADSFDMLDFKLSVNKYVSSDFIIPDKHWKYSKKIINGILGGINPWNLF